MKREILRILDYCQRSLPLVEMTRSGVAVSIYSSIISGEKNA